LPKPTQGLASAAGDRRMLAWFWGQMRLHRATIVAAIAVIAVMAGADIAPALLLRRIVDDVMTGARYGLLPLYAGGLALAFLASAVFSALRNNLMDRLGQRFVHDVRVAANRHLQELSLSFFERHRAGDLMSRLTGDVNAVEDMVSSGTDKAVTDLFRSILTIGILLHMQPTLALWSLAPVPLLLGTTFAFAMYVRPLYRGVRARLGDLNADLQENITGIRVVKAFGRESYEANTFARASQAYQDLAVRAIWLRTYFSPLMTFLSSVAVVLVIWFGVRMSERGGAAAVTTGTIMAFVYLLQQFYVRLSGVVGVVGVYNQGFAALGRVFELLDEEPEVEARPDAVELTDVQGHVLLEDVTFRYPTGETVLKHVTVEALPGEVVALVGRSGAGKTSLVNLIPRFYDPLQGRVVIDGHDVRDLTQQSLRSHLAMVLQETFLFRGTVRENIQYGRLEATEEEILTAARAAYADEFIRGLPEGYDTEIGERGVRLSGGQAQRIAIARALLVDPEILILDEATSMVDTEAEQMIQQALTNLMRGRTTFAIAHRLSTVRNANKIVVIDSGEIVEQADHETLLQAGGLYAEMYTRQLQLGGDWLGEG
jgi:ABC-type multidrug transport system fused ATPase/permease subunit